MEQPQRDNVNPADSLKDLSSLSFVQRLGLVVVFVAVFFALSWSTSDAAVINVSPADGSTFMSESVTFNWDTDDGDSWFWIYIGTTPGASDIYTSSQDTGAFQGQSFTWDTFGTLSEPVYLTFWSSPDGFGGWENIQNSFTTWDGQGGGSTTGGDIVVTIDPVVVEAITDIRVIAGYGLDTLVIACACFALFGGWKVGTIT